jgi:hypothetical protein
MKTHFIILVSCRNFLFLFLENDRVSEVNSINDNNAAMLARVVIVILSNYLLLTKQKLANP